MERIGGLPDPPQTVLVAVPLSLDLFNKLYETCIGEGVDVKTKIIEILERRFTR
jgi:hypothetical protein